MPLGYRLPGIVSASLYFRVSFEVLMTECLVLKAMQILINLVHFAFPPKKKKKKLKPEEKNKLFRQI
jgi:hypothetical protein